MTRWYRAYSGTATDPKLGGIALRANVSRSVAVATWHVILESAAEANAGGATDIDEFSVAAALGESLEDIQRVFAAINSAGMFRDGHVTAWNRRQFESDTSAERTKKWRERNKTVTEEKSDTDVTSQKKSVTPPYVYESVSVSKKEEEEKLEKQFAVFWAAKPRRKGANPRIPALKAYKSLVKSGVDPIAINACALHWASDCSTKHETEFVPMAVTWLNQQRFTDYQPEPEDAEKRAKQDEILALNGYKWDEKLGKVVKIEQETTQ